MIAKFAIGCGGAAFTLYSNIGGDLPGMGKSLEIKDLTESIDELKEKLKGQEEGLRKEQEKLSKKEISVAQFAVFERSINNQRDDWNAEILDLRRTRTSLMRSTYVQGAVIFVVLGGFFAAFLTGGALFEGEKLNIVTILSAVAMGAGWTGIVGRYIQEGALKEEAIDRNLKLDDIKNDYERIIKEKVDEYKEKIDAANKIVADYDRVVTILRGRVEDSQDVVEKYNKLKEAIKDSTVMEELAKLGIQL